MWRGSCSTWSAAEPSDQEESQQPRFAPAGQRGLGCGTARSKPSRSRGSDARSWTTISPLNDVGIPAIDLIDFDYPFWHKADDLPENCSAESLEEVGRVITTWLTQRPAGAGAVRGRKRR